MKGGVRLNITYYITEQCIREGWCETLHSTLHHMVAERMLHGACVGEEAGARNHAFFRAKLLQVAMKGTSGVRRLRLRSFCNVWLFTCA